MNEQKCRSLLLSAFLVLLLIFHNGNVMHASQPLTTPVETKPCFDRIVAFGDSLSDSGNAYCLWNQLTTPPYENLGPCFVPTYPYAETHRFCNGRTWVELLSNRLGLEGSCGPAFSKTPSDNMNYAVGRARAGAIQEPELVNLSAQIDEFIQRTKGVNLQNTLCTVEIGANDVRDILKGNIESFEQSVSAIDAAIQKLYAHGIRHFLIANLPDIGKTPALLGMDKEYPGVVKRAEELTDAFNTALKTHTLALSQLKGISIKELDMHTMLEQMIAQPQEFGFRNVSSPYIAEGSGENPNEFLFWDGIHPTEPFHQSLSEKAFSALQQEKST